MRNMQEKLLAELAKRISDLELEPVVQFAYANTGKLYAQRDVETVLTIAFAFQADNCRLTITHKLVAEWEDEPPFVRVQGEEMTWHALEYNDSPRVRGALERISDLLHEAAVAASTEGA